MKHLLSALLVTLLLSTLLVYCNNDGEPKTPDNDTSPPPKSKVDSLKYQDSVIKSGRIEYIDSVVFTK